MTWAIIGMYAAVGNALVLFGPSNSIWRAFIVGVRDDRWKIMALQAVTFIICVILWPMMSYVAMRERQAKLVLPRHLRHLARSGVREMTFCELRSLENDVKTDQILELRNGLQQLGITISNDLGPKNSARMSLKVATDLSQPIELIETTQQSVFAEARDTDEIWRFRTDSRSWECLAGRAGYALVRDGVIVDHKITLMN